MSIRNSFSAEEWARVVGAPMVAAIAVTAADPGGLWGALRESAATARGMLEGRDSGNALVAAVAADFETAEGRTLARDALKAQVAGRRPAEVVDAAVAELGAVSSLVAARAPEAVAGYRTWLGEVARRVAEAGVEGGFLGFGGEKVSASEKATLDRIAAALA